METISVGVMTNKGATFYCTLSFLWDKEEAITEEWMHDFVVSKCPNLKYQKFSVAFNNQIK